MLVTASARASIARVLDEFYRIAFRKKIYHTLDELQAGLTSGPLVLWQDPDADLPGRNP